MENIRLIINSNNLLFLVVIIALTGIYLCNKSKTMDNKNRGV